MLQYVSISGAGRVLCKISYFFTIHYYFLLNIRGRSSAGRALEWHSRGQEFDPLRLHQKKALATQVLFQ